MSPRAESLPVAAFVCHHAACANCGSRRCSQCKRELCALLVTGTRCHGCIANAKAPAVIAKRSAVSFLETTDKREVELVVTREFHTHPRDRR